MSINAPRKSALGEAILNVCAQKNTLYRKLLTEPRQPYPAWFARTHSFRGRMALMLAALPGLSGLAQRRWNAYVFGGIEHHLGSKRFVEDETRNAIQAGFRQVVIFGAGYDTLGIRLAREFNQVQLFEVDHPPTQAVKRLSLEKRMILPANLHFLPVDYRKGTLENHLIGEPPYDAHVHTLFIAVDVLPYLPDPEIDEIFNFIWEHAVVGSRVIFSFLNQALLADPSSLLAQEAAKTKKAGRPFRSSIGYDRVEQYLFQRGLHGTGFASDDHIAATYLEPAGIPRPPDLGSMIIVADKPEWAKWMLHRKVEKTSFQILGQKTEVRRKTEELQMPDQVPAEPPAPEGEPPTEEPPAT